jgi:hypothetical protein
MKKMIHMGPFGINTLVLTTHEEILQHIMIFDTSPDGAFMNGQGKLAFHSYLSRHLLEEDEFFESSLRFQKAFPQRWSQFMNGCVELAVLNHFLFNVPIEILTPKQAALALMSRKSM